MDDQEHQHLKNLRQTHERRLRVLELQAASFGLSVPPHILTEMDDIKEKIASIDKQMFRDSSGNEHLPSHYAPRAAGPPKAANAESSPTDIQQMAPVPAVPLTQPLQGESQENSDAKTADPREKTRRVVAIMHGIRDEGGWMTPLKRLIEKETGAEVAALSPDRIALTWFLLGGRYLGYVKRYRDDVATLLSNYHEAEIIFVAHSYGTWCLADVIKHWTHSTDVMPVGIILCGSILPQNYPWSDIWRKVFQRPRKQDELPWVWNDIGGRDPFPLLARLVSKQYGDAGVSRFTEPTPGLVVNRIHAGLDHGGCFLKKDDKGNNILNEDFVRKFWLPIIRGEDAPRYGDDERTVPAILRLSYWVKTAWEVKLSFIICQLLGWGLIWLFQSKLPALLGWCLVGLGGAIPLVWLWMGWIEVPSPKKPKPRRFPVILKFILIPLLIVGIVWLAATALKPKTESDPPNKDLVEHLNRVGRTLWGEKVDDMLQDSKDEAIRRRTGEIETIMYGEDAAKQLQGTSLRDQITKTILPDLFGSE